MFVEKKAVEETIKSSASCVLHWQWVHACGCNYKNVIENWVLETKNVFSVSITHHSKIKELSDGNKNRKQIQTDFFFVKPTYFELWMMETKLWIMEIANPNTLLLSQELEVHCHQKCEPLLLVHCFAIAIAILDVVNYNKSRFFFSSQNPWKSMKSPQNYYFFYFWGSGWLNDLKNKCPPKKKKMTPTRPSKKKFQ